MLGLGLGVGLGLGLGSGLGSARETSVPFDVWSLRTILLASTLASAPGKLSCWSTRSARAAVSGDPDKGSAC